MKKYIPLLMYHQVDTGDQKDGLHVSFDLFKKQIGWLLDRGFRFLTLPEVFDRRGLCLIKDRFVALTFDDGFRGTHRYALSWLREQGIPANLFVIVDWVGKEGFMDWKEICESSRNGIHIGSHSLTHRWLPDLTSRELREEIFLSKERIEDQIGTSVVAFSYPVGGISSESMRLVKEAGYRGACVASARKTIPVEDPLYGLQRIKVGESDRWRFKILLKTSLIFQAFKF